ncbi:3-oxoacid CoA-transferase subunit A [Cryobacterium sp. TMS1-20-1]|uniref:3-oxoacid CoA-transferase subunit A n=1 Tax=Cryobacterium sp. TMS1-20-1 TaxID=1259223 RepID=UPI00106B1EC1|nr:3-oxoacid CoA-transferase subunit A [Cryobacterium sp. TMS1-20-1]TFC80559.1 3-oxoacid CoA-transferase subunit A [Cryobacterium sp. TMS1-20-1]
MINKEILDVHESVADIPDGATLLIGGFGPPGQPGELIEALLQQGARDLVVINNNAGAGGDAISRLFAAGRVRKVICSFPKAIGSTVFDELYLAGKIELELVPQGNLAERIRAAGAGIAGFYTRTGYGTELAVGKEVKEFDGVNYVLERPLRADFALIKASVGDPLGNLIYRKTARNFGPIMAAAASVTIAEVDHIVPLGGLDPEHIITPGIYVDRIVQIVSTKATSEVRP